MRRVKEVIVVEGRYDKNILAQIVDATILETGGFAIFNDQQKLNLLRRLAQARGLILLTDSDGAGFVIRNFLKGALPKDRVRQAYIPDQIGKERRKRKPGKEGKLGVEGMTPDILMHALETAGATFDDVGEDSGISRPPSITRLDLYQMGLSGGRDSAARRLKLQHDLDLPEHLSTGALLDVLNLLFTREELLNRMSDAPHNM
jgi:ribonuclease M5